MKQELWAVPFFLVLLGMVGLCVCDMDKMILMTESPPSFQILVHLNKNPFRSHQPLPPEFAF